MTDLTDGAHAAPKVITGSCHCGSVRWSFEGDPGEVTACNCTLCRRYGVLWAYDYENQRIHISGPTAAYTRADKAAPFIEINFCPSCGCVICWRAKQAKPGGQRRMAVNMRLAPPEEVAHLPVRHFDGLNDFQDLPGDGCCVKNLWF